MNSPLEAYIDSSYSYDFTKGPTVVTSPEAARRLGINCVSLAHLALRDLFGYTLPPELLCTEMYFDTEHLRSVPRPADLQTGDIIWLGTESAMKPGDFQPIYEGRELVNWHDFPINHMAIVTGARNKRGDHLLLDASERNGTPKITPMRSFANYWRHGTVHGASRLVSVPQLPQSLVS